MSGGLGEHSSQRRNGNGTSARQDERGRGGRSSWLQSAGWLVCLAIAVSGIGLSLRAQSPAWGTADSKVPARWIGVGDSPDTALPVAKDLSAKLTKKAIDKAMRKVGDWELAKARPYFSRDWTFAAMYTGYVTAARVLPDPAYRDAMVDLGNKFEWRLGPRVTHADDQAIGQTYLGLYLELRRPEMLSPTKTQFDGLMKLEDDPKKPVWWWCDALFMAPDVWAKLYKITGEGVFRLYGSRVVDHVQASVRPG